MNESEIWPDLTLMKDKSVIQLILTSEDSGLELYYLSDLCSFFYQFRCRETDAENQEESHERSIIEDGILPWPWCYWSVSWSDSYNFYYHSSFPNNNRPSRRRFEGSSDWKWAVSTIILGGLFFLHPFLCLWGVKVIICTNTYMCVFILFLPYAGRVRRVSFLIKASYLYKIQDMKLFWPLPFKKKSRIPRGKEEFGLWAVSKTLWATHQPVTFRVSEWE